MSTGKTYSTKYLLDNNNNRGSEGQVLISTSEGVNWSDGSDIIGGPYLPLSAGSSYPLTDTLFGTNTSMSGNGTYAGSMNLGNGGGTGEKHLTIGNGSTGNGYRYIDLVGDTTYTDYGLRIIRGNSGANTSSQIVHRGTGDFSLQTTEAGKMRFVTANSERMRITSTGDIGIGTSSPAELLNVNKENAESVILISRGGTNPAASTDIGKIKFASDYNNVVTEYGHIKTYANSLSAVRGSMNFSVKSTSGAVLTGMTVHGTSAGVNVGIGTTSPDVKLQINHTGGNNGIRIISPNDVNGFLQFGDSDDDNVGRIVYGHSNDSMQFVTNDAERMRITNTGNVGIGTTSPGARLDVDKSAIIGSESTANSTTNIENVLKVKGKNNYSDGTTWYGDYGQILLSATNNMTSSARQFLITNALDNSKFAIIRSTDWSTPPLTNSTAAGVNSGTADFVIDNVGNVGIGTTSNSADETNNGVPKLQVNTTTAVLGEFPLAARFTTASDAGDNSGVSVLINSGNDRGLMISAGRAVSNRARATLNLVQYDGNELVDGITLYQPNTASEGATTGTNVGIGTTSPGVNFQVGDGTTDTSSKFYHNDNTYTQVSGYGLYFSRLSSYIRPVFDGTQDLYFGNINRTWKTIQFDATTITFDNNSSEAMRIDDTGNVGIGTTSPGVKFVVNGGNDNEIAKFLSTDDTAQISISDNDTNAFFGVKNGVAFISQTGGTPASGIAVDSSGNVGIGTTSPGANLEINDASAPKIRFGRGSSYYWDIGHTTSDFQIQSQTGGTIMHLEYTGNVGIGTTSPDEMLHIENSSGANIILNSNTGAVNNGIYMSEGTSSTPTQNGAYFYYDSSANAVKLDTGTSSLSTKLTVSRDSGNVGIGTTSPANTLNVNGDIGYIGVIGQGSIYGNTGNSSYADMQLYNPSTGYSTFNNQSYGYYFNTSGGTKLTILNNGNVGIGTTSPSEKLEVNGNISIGTSSQWIGKDNESNSFGFNASTGQYINSTASISLAIDSNNSDSDTRFFRIIKNSYGYGNGSELFRVNENGNVGIGTTSPSKKLEVNGNFKLGTNAYIEYGGVYPYTITTANTAAVGNLVFSAGLGSAAYESRIDLQGTNTAGVAGITLSTAATARMVVTADGDVGIGTTTPNAKLDIQGTQGQLFSVTDDLSGDIFSVADISGVPIFDINSNGLSTFDGEVDIKTSFGGSNFYQLGVGTTSSGSIYAEGRIFCGGTTFTNGEAIFNDKVGIGTTSPENKLHVQQSALYTGIQTTAGIRVKSDGGSAIGNYHGTIALSRGTGSVAISAVQEATDSDVMGMAFFTHPSATGGDAAVEQMRIDQNGNVGIGTTSPVVKLDVEAGSTGDAQGDSTTAAIFRAGRQNVWFQNQRTAAGTDWNNNTFKIIANIDSTSHQSINFVNDASYNEHIDIYTGNQVFNTRFNANGNVGIGTTSPGAKLEVKGSGTSPIVYFGNGVDNAPNRQLAFSGGSSGLVWDLDATGASSVGGQLTLSTNGTERMRINSSGNVGIGTTSPSDKLHVNGTVRSQAPATSDWALLGYNSAGSAASGLWFDNGDGELLLRDDSGNLNVRLRSDTSSYINGGNLGLGTTSPAQKLTVNSGRMLVSNTTTPIYIKAGSTYKSWVHHIGGSDGYIFAPSTADNGETWDWANQTKLGANGVVTAKNFQLSSDERFKNNIKDIKDIKVEAAFKSFEMESSPGEKRYGVVAQELEKTNPELVETDHEGFKSVKYIDLLIAKIAELEARLEKLEK